MDGNVPRRRSVAACASRRALVRYVDAPSSRLGMSICRGEEAAFGSPTLFGLLGVPRAAEACRRQIALGLDGDEREALKAVDSKIKSRHTANAVLKQSGLFRGPSDSRPYSGMSGTPAATLEGINPSVSQSSCLREDSGVHHARPAFTQLQWRK